MEHMAVKFNSSEVGVAEAGWGGGPGPSTQEAGAAPPEGARRPVSRICTAPWRRKKKPEQLKWSKNQM